MVTIPNLDYRHWHHGDANSQLQLARELCHALETLGFVQLAHHPIAPALEAAAWHQTTQLFQLTPGEKAAIAWQSSQANRGYVSLGQESLNPGITRDVKEAFNLGAANSPAHLNRWPASLPEFRSVLLDFYAAANELVFPLLTALAVGLDLPKETFACHHQAQFHTLRLLHYPPISAAPVGTLRAGEHTDYGSITLLFQQQPGLAVQCRQGTWHRVEPQPGTILINIGDLMQRWTGDRLRSTPHRVEVVSHENGRSSRYAMALFCDPNPATLITPLRANQGKSYPPITAGAYLQQRLTATY